MATMTYRQYLKKTGKKPTEAAARAWDRLYNGGKRFNPPPAPSATGAVAPPEFDFNGPLDQTGEADRTNLDFDSKRRQSSIDTAYNAGKAELDARGVDLTHNRNEGFRSADSNAAARGILRSGIQETNRGNVLRNYLTGQQGITRARTNLTNQRQADMDQTNADYQQGMTNIRTGAIGRRYQRWRDENGGL